MDETSINKQDDKKQMKLIVLLGIALPKVVVVNDMGIKENKIIDLLKERLGDDVSLVDCVGDDCNKADGREHEGKPRGKRDSSLMPQYGPKVNVNNKNSFVPRGPPKLEAKPADERIKEMMNTSLPSEVTKMASSNHFRDTPYTRDIVQRVIDTLSNGSTEDLLHYNTPQHSMPIIPSRQGQGPMDEDDLGGKKRLNRSYESSQMPRSSANSNVGGQPASVQILDNQPEVEGYHRPIAWGDEYHNNGNTNSNHVSSNGHGQARENEREPRNNSRMFGDQSEAKERHRSPEWNNKDYNSNSYNRAVSKVNSEGKDSPETENRYNSKSNSRTTQGISDHIVDPAYAKGQERENALNTAADDLSQKMESAYDRLRKAKDLKVQTLLEIQNQRSHLNNLETNKMEIEEQEGKVEALIRLSRNETLKLNKMIDNQQAKLELLREEDDVYRNKLIQYENEKQKERRKILMNSRKLVAIDKNVEELGKMYDELKERFKYTDEERDREREAHGRYDAEINTSNFD